MTRATLHAGLAGILAGFLVSCDRQELTGPPVLRLGRDQCAECGMIIMEDRCSSAVLAEIHGRREHLLYDDIGCMLDHLAGNARQTSVLERFVHDHASRSWLPASEACFLAADPVSLHTPMGTGLVAFATCDSAQAMRASHGGEVLDFAGISERREERARRLRIEGGG